MSRGAGISTIGVVTADRPVALARAVRSIARQCQIYGHQPRLLVVDGSRAAVNRTANRAIVDRARVADRLLAEYVGPEEAFTLAQALRRRVRDLPRLAPGDAGANRTLLLLLTAGEHILSIDDDIVCTTWAVFPWTERLAVVAHHDQRRAVGFFGSRRAARAAAGHAPVDLVAAHARLLDRPVASLAAEFGQSADVSDACAHLGAGLAGHARHVVRATFAGLAGDDGGYCPYRRLFGPPWTWQRLWSSAAGFQMSFASREILRVATATTISHDANFQTFCMGLSNRALLPPFLPAGRNEDGLFGAMIARCDPEAVFGHLPVGVVHDSHRPSKRTGPAMISARETRSGDVLVALLRQAPRRLGSGTAERIQQIGQLLLEAGTGRDRAIEERITSTMFEKRRRDFDHARTALRDASCPDYWRDALDRYEVAYLWEVGTRGFFLPIEFHGLASVRAGYRAFGAFLRGFGRLLSVWPEAWETARELNAFGALPRPEIEAPPRPAPEQRAR